VFEWLQRDEFAALNVIQPIQFNLLHWLRLIVVNELR
jgi:hypothetical protein